MPRPGKRHPRVVDQDEITYLTCPNALEGEFGDS